MRFLRLLITIAIVILPSFGLEAQAQDSSDSSEYLIKAGFIYNFAKLVEWPSNAFAQPDSPIVIGILGDGSLRNNSRSDAGGQESQWRGHFVVKRLKCGNRTSRNVQHLVCKLVRNGASGRGNSRL